MNNYSKIIKPDIQILVKNNVNLVKKIAWHLHGRVSSIIEIEDMIQIGMLGLINAAQNYILQKDASFSSYASIRIKGEILDYLRKNSKINIDLSVQKNAIKENFLQLNELIKLTDKSFSGAVKAQEKKQINGIENLEKRLIRAEKRVHKDSLSRLITLKNELFPKSFYFR